MCICIVHGKIKYMVMATDGWRQDLLVSTNLAALDRSTNLLYFGSPNFIILPYFIHFVQMFLFDRKEVRILSSLITYCNRDAVDPHTVVG